jgi:HK97 family phage prohead protease
MTSLGSHLYRPHYKTLRVTKSPSDGSGYFEGLASTWEVDRDNERFAFGAWSESVFEWQKTASYPALFYDHKSKDPNDIIGQVISMKETVDGLWIAAQLDLTNDRAVAAYERLLSGVLNTMSVGFIYELKHRDDNGVTVIDRAELLEVSLTPVPSNAGARVTQVKVHEIPPDDPHFDWLTEAHHRRLRERVEAEAWEWDQLLYEVEHSKYVRRDAEKVDVDAFILAEKERATAAKLDEAEQQRWESEMADRARAIADLTPEDEAAREFEYRQREATARLERDLRKMEEVDAENRADDARRLAARRDPNVYAE